MVEYGVISLCDHLPSISGVAGFTQGQRLHAISDLAVRAEQADFDVFGVGEHHFSDYILPSPELMLAHVAARTSRIRLSTSVTLLAKRDPVRYAEAFAVLDQLSNGRAEATFARGVSERTAQVFGIEDFDELRPIFDEHLRLVLRLLTEESVTWEGDFRSPLEAVRIEPRPRQAPSAAFWIGGGLSEVSAALAAELGLPFHLPSLFRWPSDYVEIVAFYRNEAERLAKTPRVGFPSYLHVAKTSQLAKAQWQPHLDHYVDFASASRSSFGRPTDFDSLITGPAICGSPAEVTERIAEINDTLGLDRHIFLMDAGSLPDPALHGALELMGSDVLPALREPALT